LAFVKEREGALSGFRYLREKTDNASVRVARIRRKTAAARRLNA